MKLYVMRHGPAEEEAASGIDADRALSSAGRERVHNVARALVDAGEDPVDVVTSPLVRAVQTAEIVAIATRLGNGKGVVSVRREVAPGGTGAQFARSAASDGRRRLMLVGHEPDLSGIVSTLLGIPFGRPFDKAMVVGLQLTSDRGHARLRFVLDPKALRWEYAE